MSSRIFYKSLINNNTNPVTDTEAWEVTKGDIYNYVTDSDIERAMSQAIINANPRFGSDDTERINIYLHLIAFYLVMDLRNASGGVSGMFGGVCIIKERRRCIRELLVPELVNEHPVIRYLFAKRLWYEILVSHTSLPCGYDSVLTREVDLWLMLRRIYRGLRDCSKI